MFFIGCILHRRHVVGAQTAQSQRDVSFEHQHMIREVFIVFHSESLVCFNINR